MQPQFTIPEIAEALCNADGLILSDHKRAYSQVRHMVRLNLLPSPTVIDKRGTLSFPAVAVYRARLFKEIIDISADLTRVAGPVIHAENESAPVGAWPERTNTASGARNWRGLEDIALGVTAATPAEDWRLQIGIYAATHTEEPRIVARYVWTNAPADGLSEADIETVESTFPAKIRWHFDIHLNELFANLPPLS